MRFLQGEMCRGEKESAHGCAGLHTLIVHSPILLLLQPHLKIKSTDQRPASMRFSLLLLFLLFSSIYCDSSSSASSLSVAEEEQGNENLLIFAFLLILGGAVLVIYLVVKSEVHYLPERYLIPIHNQHS